MALQSFFKTFFRAVRLRKGVAPATSADHAQIYCSTTGEMRVKLPSGDDVDMGSVESDATTGASTTPNGTLKLVVNGTTYWLLTSATQD